MTPDITIKEYKSGVFTKQYGYRSFPPLRQLSVSNLSKLELLISFDGTSYTTTKTLLNINIAGSYSKYIENVRINRVKEDQQINADTAYPVLSFTLKKELGFKFENSPKKNTYLEYYHKIRHLNSNENGRVLIVDPRWASIVWSFKV